MKTPTQQAKNKIIEGVLKDKETSSFGVVAKLDDGFSIVLKKKLKLALSSQKAEIHEIINEVLSDDDDDVGNIFGIDDNIIADGKRIIRQYKRRILQQIEEGKNAKNDNQKSI